MSDHITPIFGTKLPNGATVIAASARNTDEWIILAEWQGTFVTWKAKRPGDLRDTRWGYYGETLGDAVNDYYERA